MMMKLGAAAQQMGGLFVCFNTEAANRDSAHLSRVIPTLAYDEILFYQPDYIEQTIDSIHSIVDTVSVDSAPVFISIDSINSCPTRHEMEAEAFKSKDMSGAEIASIWSQALRQLTNKLSKKPVVLCMVSQTRTGGIGSYRTKEISGGGAAPYFYASTVIKTFGKSILYQNEPGGPYKSKPTNLLQEKAAQECELALLKSRFSSGGSKLEYVINFRNGIHFTEGLVDMLVYYGIIESTGSWYSYNGQKLGQGKEKVKAAVVSNDVLQTELIEKLNRA
jgi:recombination protein RecA